VLERNELRNIFLNANERMKNQRTAFATSSSMSLTEKNIAKQHSDTNDETCDAPSHHDKKNPCQDDNDITYEWVILHDEVVYEDSHHRGVVGTDDDASSQNHQDRHRSSRTLIEFVVQWSGRKQS
jgi:hypothetical protein